MPATVVAQRPPVWSRSAAAGKPVERIHAQYEAWPYPRIPLLGQVPRNHTWQLNASYLADRCGVPAPSAPARIWIAGCGTFQPYVFGLANPGAALLCSDISAASLRLARRRCRWHGIAGARFETIDLNRPEQWPDGPFDLIECYGVLMNLADPQRTLSELQRRLTEHGVLRLMVYTHYARQRIFQIQRVAQLLGLNAGVRSHPRRLRAVMKALPSGHPLRFTFECYPDAQNDEGVVDGFLHAADHGFTGVELGRLIADAGLCSAFWFHRPWGQPVPMADALGMADRSQSFVLHYLDLWQELRTNFVVCLTRQDMAAGAAGVAALHPLFDTATVGLGWRDRWRIRGGRLFGHTLPSRTEAAAVAVSAQTLRACRRGDGRAKAVLQRAGIVVGGSPPAVPRTRQSPLREPEPSAVRLPIGSRVANPLYRQLFDAYTMHLTWPAAGLDDLAAQVVRWNAHATALENDTIRFGLTPHATYQKFGDAVDSYLARWDGLETVEDYAALRVPADARARTRAQAFAASWTPSSRPTLSDAELRELWILVYSFDRLFLDLDADS